MNSSAKIGDRLRVHAELCRKLAAQEPHEDRAGELRRLADECCPEPAPQPQPEKR